MRIGSVLLAIWLFIGGIAAAQRGDYKGPVSCSTASTIAITIIAGPFNYAGANPDINCTVQTLSGSAAGAGPGPSGRRSWTRCTAAGSLTPPRTKSGRRAAALL